MIKSKKSNYFELIHCVTFSTYFPFDIEKVSSEFTK